MNLSAPNDPLSRDHRRIDFAKRLTWHGARTSTIMKLTGLTFNKLAGYRRSWNVPEDTRLRGSGPKSLQVFLSTPKARTHTAALLSLCFVFNALPRRNRDYAPDGTWNIEVAIRLCEAYEAYHAIIRVSNLEFDELMLLIREVESGAIIQMGRCKTCKAAIVIAKHDPLRPICMHCQPRH
jgi:Flagellar transcriptional activator (FlhC)